MCVGVSLFCVEKQALFVSFGMKKKKKKKNQNKKNVEKQKERNLKKVLSSFTLLHQEWCKPSLR